LENLDDDDDDDDDLYEYINRTWEGIRESIKPSATYSPGYYDFKQHKPWCYEECSKLLDQSKQARLQWL